MYIYYHGFHLVLQSEVLGLRLHLQSHSSMTKLTLTRAKVANLWGAPGQHFMHNICSSSFRFFFINRNSLLFNCLLNWHGWCFFIFACHISVFFNFKSYKSISSYFSLVFNFSFKNFSQCPIHKKCQSWKERTIRDHTCSCNWYFLWPHKKWCEATIVRI